MKSNRGEGIHTSVGRGIGGRDKGRSKEEYGAKNGWTATTAAKRGRQQWPREIRGRGGQKGGDSGGFDPTQNHASTRGALVPRIGAHNTNV